MEPQGRYTILGEIASGGTATVFLAEDVLLRRKVALKKLHPHLHNHAEVVKRFEKEAVAVASLSHENVIKVYDFGRQADHGLFLAMEYVDGASLDVLLAESDGALPNLAALTLFHQLLAGLAAAHAHGICHRDIKPSNVLVDQKGCVRIADFGIAFLSEETSITKTGSYLGTPGYSSPEQAEGKTVTVKTDIFAAGTLLYRSLSGRLPFEAETPHAVLVAIMEKIPERLNQVNRRVLPGLADLAERMLAKTPGERPSAEECAAHVVSLAQGLGFELDAGRIRRLREAPRDYAARENQELALRYARQARLTSKLGKAREAMKQYSLAEAFAEKGGEIAEEAAGYLRRTQATRRRRKAAFIGAVTLMAAGAAYEGFRVLRREAPQPESVSPHSSRPGIVASPQPPPPQETVAPVPAASGNSAAAAATPAGMPKEPANAEPTVTAVLPKAALPAKPKSARPVPMPPEPAPPAPAVSQAPAVAPVTAPGYLWIKTNPPFARITLDGKSMGATPLSAPLSVAAGPHRLELEREGCVPHQGEVTVAPAETLSLRFTLDRKPETP